MTLQDFLNYNYCVRQKKHKKLFLGGNMKLKVWGKTLLSIYNCLFKLVEEIDKIVEDFALKGGMSYGFNSSLFNMQKIIDLTERKITLINVKVLVEQIMEGLDDTSCKILTLKFIDKIPSELVVKALGLTRRTFYRRFNNGLETFARKLKSLGYDEKNMIDFIRDEHWIFEVYKDFCEKEIQEEFEESFAGAKVFSLINRNIHSAKKMRS